MSHAQKVYRDSVPLMDDNLKVSYGDLEKCSNRGAQECNLSVHPMKGMFKAAIREPRWRNHREYTRGDATIGQELRCATSD